MSPIKQRRRDGKTTESSAGEYQGSINTKVFAGIIEKGDLYLYGYDTGNLPTRELYDDDVEYMLSVPADEKEKVRHLIIQAVLSANQPIPDFVQVNHEDDSVLLKLLDYHYRGVLSAFNDFKTLLEKNQINFTFNWG